jgi:hypothetical protein
VVAEIFAMPKLKTLGTLLQHVRVSSYIVFLLGELAKKKHHQRHWVYLNSNNIFPKKLQISSRTQDPTNTCKFALESLAGRNDRNDEMQMSGTVLLVSVTG